MTIAESERTPIRASWPATFASGGPSSTRTRALRCLQQRRIALADVEERDAEPGRRVPRGRRPGRDPHRHDERRRHPRRTAASPSLCRGMRTCRRAARATNHRRDGERAQRQCGARPDLRAGKIGDDSRDELEPGSRPARERSKTGCSGRRDRIDHGGEQPEAEDERRGREREHVRGNRVERSVAEVEQHDRRRRETARERDRERIRHARRERIAVERVRTRGTATKIAATAANDSWNPGSRSRRGHPGEQHERSDREEVPAVARAAASQASDASAPATPARATDGCQPTARTYVGDRNEDRELAPRSAAAARASRGRRPRRRGRRRSDPRQRAGGRARTRGSRPARPRGSPSSSPRTTPSTMPRRTPLVPRPTARSIRSRSASPKPGDSAAPPDLTPARRLEHDVDALAREPRALVEAVLRGPRLRDANRRLEDRPARRRATDGQHEKHALTDALAPERPSSRRGRASSTATNEPVRPSRARRRRSRRAPRRGRSGEARPCAATPSRARRARARRRRAASRADAVERSAAAEGDRATTPRRRERQRDPDGEREPDARRCDEKRRPVELDDAPHGVTRSRSCSIRVGPMPGTASRSSTDANGPCSAR